GRGRWGGRAGRRRRGRGRRFRGRSPPLGRGGGGWACRWSTASWSSTAVPFPSSGASPAARASSCVCPARDRRETLATPDRGPGADRHALGGGRLGRGGRGGGRGGGGGRPPRGGARPPPARGRRPPAGGPPPRRRPAARRARPP